MTKKAELTGKTLAAIAYSAFCGLYGSVTYTDIGYTKYKYEIKIQRGLANMIIGPLITPFCLIKFANNVLTHGISDWTPDIRKRDNRPPFEYDFSITPLFLFRHEMNFSRIEPLYTYEQIFGKS